MNINWTDLLAMWGPGALILLGLYYLLRDFNKTFLKSFLDNQSRQTAATENQGRAITTLCSELASSRLADDYSHREIILNIKVLQTEVEKSRLELADQRKILMGLVEK